MTLTELEARQIAHLEDRVRTLEIMAQSQSLELDALAGQIESTRRLLIEGPPEPRSDREECRD